MYQFQKNESSAKYLLNILISFDGETPLENIVCLNLLALPYKKTC